MRNIFVTGGYGFIGSHFIRHLLSTYDDITVYNIDKMTYAAKKENLSDVEIFFANRYRYSIQDISSDLSTLFKTYKPWAVVNFAAETHVDRAIKDSDAFLKTNVLGVNNVLRHSLNNGIERFIHISTDEVYGPAINGESFSEESCLKPRNPYAASKAAGDMLIQSYINTYDFPGIIVRPSNAYGPGQFPEKFIPLAITSLIRKKKIPVYGDGKQIREWTYVSDIVRGIDFVLRVGNIGEIYNISSSKEFDNISLLKYIISLMKEYMSIDERGFEFVEDRPGHDRRYSVDSAKIRKLGWIPYVPIRQGMIDTISWYIKNILIY